MAAAEPRSALRTRNLSEDDLARVLEIERGCFSTPWHESTFRGLIRRTDTDLVAAELDGVLVGYAVCWTILDQAELGNVAVAPAARSRGTGQLLVEAAMARIRGRGARECFLEVRETNVVAQALYRSHGFDVVGRRRGYYSRPTEDALVMRLLLGTAQPVAR